MIEPAKQGEVWDCYLGEVRGREQDGRRPCLVISVDELSAGPGDLAIVVPLTRTHRVATEVRVDPPNGGLQSTSYALPYQVRAISRERLKKRRGTVSTDLVRAVIANVHLLTRPPTVARISPATDAAAAGLPVTRPAIRHGFDDIPLQEPAEPVADTLTELRGDR